MTVAPRCFAPAAVICILAAAAPGHAQEVFGNAALIGVAGSYAALPGEPAVFRYNPALSMQSKSNGAELSYRHLFQISEMEDLTGSVVCHPGPATAVAAGLTHFGSSGLYSELTLSTALGRLVRPGWSLGIGVTYNRIEFGAGAASYSGATIDFGTAWQYSPRLLIGAALRGITIDGLWENDNPPYAADVSIAWSLPPDLTIAGRWYRAEGGDDRLAIGQILRLTTQASFHSGLRFDPIRYALGGEVHQGNLRINYAYEGHPDLGGTHTVGLGWAWR